MAAIVLSMAGAAFGNSLFGALGGTMFRLAGAVAGNIIDNALFGSGKTHEGPRLKSLDVQASTEGAAIARVYGRMRLAGQVIWATKFEEVASTSGGGKGLGGRPKTRTYDYFANVAIGLCEGPIAAIGRIWADGKIIDQTTLSFRLYRGDETQSVDPLIAARQGAAAAPAYRGLAYVVFERLPLARFGNRLPQLSFEVIRPVGALEAALRSVCIIPGSTEHGYDMRVLQKADGAVGTLAENRHTFLAGSDAAVALDELVALCPRLRHIALVVAWMGDDLRLSHCKIRPCVENRTKIVRGAQWSVSGETRANARLVTEDQGRPALGGTPSDDSVVSFIRAAKARGLAVTLYPFIMMDIAPGNALPNPLTGATGQPAYPWRGQITCMPAPGQSGSPDGTMASTAQVQSFFGAAKTADFSVFGGVVGYHGPEDWGLRRMVLHMAHLAAAAGGVDGFIIGSEMVALTRLRDGDGGYPAVSELVRLASDVKTVLPLTPLTYAADWTEYGAHVHGRDVRFPLDPLWACPAIAAIGIDFYAPLADWRDGTGHSDARVETPHDPAYLKANLRGGEGFDYYYASSADRAAQRRTPIADALGKSWMFRPKDLLGWWSNPHVERRDGAETVATAWVPKSKPIWLTEVGFPAVDKGANQPSCFPDAKSSVGGLPYFSSGQRDDMSLRSGLMAVLAGWDAALGASDTDNPISPLYQGPMVAPARVSAWAYDARPWPAFPMATGVWSDGANWTTGHWLNGRLGGLTLTDLVRAILRDYGLDVCDVAALDGAIDGFVLDRPMSARAALDNLAALFQFSAREEGGRLVFSALRRQPCLTLTASDHARDGQHPLVSITRGQETELPNEITLGFLRTEADYRPSSVSSRRLVGVSRRQETFDIALAASPAVLAGRLEEALHARWAACDEAHLIVPPSCLALAIGDVVTVEIEGRMRRMRVSEASGDLLRRLTLRSVPPVGRAMAALAPPPPALAVPKAYGPPLMLPLDLPLLNESTPPVLQHVALCAAPWPGPCQILRRRGDTFTAEREVGRCATMGVTLTPLAAAPPWLWDRRNSLAIRLHAGTLAGLPPGAVLSGGNAMALKTPKGWEIIQFAEAALIGEKTYRLTSLIRGQLGSEGAMAALLPAGATCILLDEAVTPLETAVGQIGQQSLWRAVPGAHDIAGPQATDMATVPVGAALMPFAPAFVSARLEAGGLRLVWRRRCRAPIDNWDIEPPLLEEAELYRLELHTQDGQRLRSASLTQAEWLYPLADLDTDARRSARRRLSIAQVSALMGPGHPLVLELDGYWLRRS